METIRVAAAADLANAEKELSTSFADSHPGTAVSWVTGASGSLAQQIENGAPYDLFLSANAEYVDRLLAEGKLQADTVVVYAVGRVGILWRDGKRHPLKDLRTEQVRVLALPNAKLAPYGAAAVEALQHAGIWEQVRPKTVLGENVRQTLEIFDSGNADAVLTAAALLKGRDAGLIPDAWHTPILQKGAVVVGSQNAAAARRFLKYVVSPEGQAILARAGFSKDSDPKNP